MSRSIAHPLAKSGLLAGLIVVGTTSPAAAAPTIFPREGNKLGQVSNTTSSVVLADSVDVNTLYVMPPPSGRTSLANLVYSANTGFCREMIDLQQYSRQLSGRIATVTSEVEVYDEELDLLRREKGEFLEQAAAVKASSEAVDRAEELEDAIEDAQDRIDDLRDLRDDCDDDDACRDDLEEEIDRLKDEVSSLKDELRATRREAGDDLRAYERLLESAEAVQRQIDDVFALIDQKVEFIGSGKDQLFNLYKNLGRLEGATASVAFRLGWNDNVSAIRGANPGFNVTPIPTSDVRVAANLIPGLGTDRYLESLPAVLDLSVAGRLFDPNESTQTLPAVADVTPVVLRLSVIGACTQKSPELFQIEKDQQGLPVYGLVQTYLYPSTFRTNVTANVNLWKTYSYLKRVTTKGGFFKSRTKTQVLEDGDGDIGVEIVSSDESGLTREELAALEQMIQLEALQDVMRLMGVPQYASGGGVEVVQPGESGALVLATGVEKTCGWLSYWCGGVSWLLRGLNGVFGGSKAEAEFRQRFDYSATRSYSRDAVSNRQGIIAFD